MQIDFKIIILVISMAEQSTPHPLLIEQLRDLHLPDHPPWWTMSVGWWCVLAVVAAALMYLAFKALRSRYPKPALLCNDLENVYQHWLQDGNTTLYLQKVAQILRAHAIETHGRTAVAKLHGSDWIKWLERQQGKPLEPVLATAISEACYQPAPEVDIKAVHDALQHWALYVTSSAAASQETSATMVVQHNA